MNLKDLFKGIFCLVIRLIGLAFLYQVMESVSIMVATYYAMPFSMARKDLITRFLMMVWQVAIAYWMLRGAPQLVRLAYPDSENQARSPAPPA